MPQQIGSFLPIILLLVFFYFFLIRPQQVQQKRRQEMLSGLKRGDRIVTVGGVVGTIMDIREDTLMLKISDNVQVELLKSGVGYVRSNEKRT